LYLFDDHTGRLRSITIIRLQFFNITYVGSRIQDPISHATLQVPDPFLNPTLPKTPISS